MEMLKYAIFSIPIIVLLGNTIDNIFFSNESTQRHINSVNAYGIKGTILRKPIGLLVLGSFVASYWYIKLGFIWAAFGLIMLSTIVLLVLIPSQPVEMPEIGSKDYFNLVLKRKRQAIVGSFIALFWAASWLVT